MKLAAGSPLLKAASIPLIPLMLLATGLLASPAAGAPSVAGSTTLTVSPSRGLIDTQAVVVRINGGAYGSVYTVAECDPDAVKILAQGASPQDACDARHNAILAVDAAGAAAGRLTLPVVLTTAIGAADCRKVQCFLAAFARKSTGGVSLLVQNLTFAADACRAPGSCTTPANAWDPSLGPAPTARAPSGSTTTTASHLPAGSPSARLRHPLTVGTEPTIAGDLTAAGSVTGPYVALPHRSAPTSPVDGEGLLRLAMAAPDTSWGPGAPSSTVADATLIDATTGRVVGEQQFVLFWGASPFVYAGFVGPVTTGHRYRVKISVEPAASQGGLSQPAPGKRPRVVLVDRALEVVTPKNPQYLAYAYAPVMYGRSTSALHDVPLLMDATANPEAGGATALSYVIAWSHEDAGTGFQAFFEWGGWGRMTDIESAIAFTVEADGSVSGARYLTGGQPAEGFPDSQSGPDEMDVPFSGAWSGHHPEIRDATGNNVFSDQGTTAFRFQLAPVAAPSADQTREAVMDANPFTYQVMGQEVTRWYCDRSTDPDSPQPGDATQYAIVDLETNGEGVSSVAVNLQLSGGSRWYRSDLGWVYPLVGTGHVRTVVKLPSAWASKRVTAVQVAVQPPAAAGDLTVDSLRVKRFTGRVVQTVATPTPVVVGEVLHVQPAPASASHLQGPHGPCVG